MKRGLLITLALILALAGWTQVHAEDEFYVISGMKRNYAPVPKTGQNLPFGTRDDGALQKGVAWPAPRFIDNLNGTITDNLTGLIWMKNANAFGLKNWVDALSAANALASGMADLSDGSQAGDWRLPNVKELQSLIDYSQYNPALPANYPFSNVQSDNYWSSTSWDLNYAWFLYFYDGYTDYLGPYGDKTNTYYVWCVRGGP